MVKLCGSLLGSQVRCFRKTDGQAEQQDVGCDESVVQDRKRQAFGLPVRLRSYLHLKLGPTEL